MVYRPFLRSVKVDWWWGGGCALLGEEVWMRAFAKGTAEVEPAFLFV